MSDPNIGLPSPPPDPQSVAPPPPDTAEEKVEEPVMQDQQFISTIEQFQKDEIGLMIATEFRKATEKESTISQEKGVEEDIKNSRLRRDEIIRSEVKSEINQEERARNDSIVRNNRSEQKG